MVFQIGCNILKRILIILFIYALSLPLFFLILRVKLFHTLPYDYYFEFVLSWDGIQPNFEWYKPTGYRLLYIYLGYIIYQVIPVIPLSQLGDINLLQIKAIASFAFLSYFFWIGSSILIYKYLYKLNTPVSISLFTSLVIFGFIGFMAYYGIDPLYIFYLILILMNRKKYWVYFSLCLLSIIICEKLFIGLIFFYLYQFLFVKNQDHKYLWPPLIASILYIIMNLIFPLSGWNPIDFHTMMPENLSNSLYHLISVKGIYMNIFPIFLLFVIWKLSLKNKALFLSRSKKLQPLFVLICFYILAFITNLQYTIGRIALHALPFFIPAIVNSGSIILNRKLSLEYNEQLFF